MNTYHSIRRQFTKRTKRRLSAISLIVLSFTLGVSASKAKLPKEIGASGGLRRELSNGFRVPGSFNTVALRDAAKFAPADDLFTFGPSQVKPGSSHQLTVKSNQCEVNKFDADNTVITDDEAKALKENHKFDISNRKVIDKCEFTADLKVGDDAPFETVTITLHYKKTVSGKTTDEPTTIDINVVKDEPVPPGPLVPGLNPQVDIMWSVVPQKVVKDNFGHRVGNLFYCLEVVIGNDTGYNLQIATVGFQLGPTGPNASLVVESSNAVSQTVLKDQQDTLQQGLKLATEGCKKELKTYEDYKAYLDCVSDATARVIKDMTNRQAVTVAALQRQRDVLAALPPNSPDNTLPSTSYRMTRGSVEHGQFWNVRNTGVNLLRAFGPFLTGFTPYFRNVNHQTNFSEAINIISNPLEKGFEIVVPDETVQQLQRLDEQTLRDGMIILNNQQIRTKVFIPKKVLNLDKKYVNDPRVVMMSLGKLHIIGDLIEYKNRISVTSNGSGEVIPPPTVNSQPFIFQLSKEEDPPSPIRLTGTNLKDASLESPDTDVTISDVTTTDTSLSGKIKVKETATLGPHTLNLTNASRTIPISITVTQPPPEGVALAAPTPAIPSLVAEKKSYQFKVTGRFLQGAKLFTGTSQQWKTYPLTFDDPHVAPDLKSFTVNIGVPANTPIGDYDFLVANQQHDPDGSQKITISIAKRTTLPNVAADVKLDKPAKQDPLQADSYTLAITGQNLNGVSQIALCDQTGTTDLGLDLSGHPQMDGDKLKVTIKVPQNKVGTTRLMLIDLDQQHSNCFDFTIAPQDKLTVNANSKSVTPTAPPAADGTISVTISGTNMEGATATLVSSDGSSNVPVGWTITPLPNPNTNPTQLVIIIKPPSDWIADSNKSPKAITLKIANTNKTEPLDTVEVKLR